jgi:hypothetical protein
MSKNTPRKKKKNSYLAWHLHVHIFFKKERNISPVLLGFLSLKKKNTTLKINILDPANGKVEVETLKKDTSDQENGKRVQTPVSTGEEDNQAENKENNQATDPIAQLSEKRKSLFEPLEPTNCKRERISNEDLLPPPDFDDTSYPKGWLVGKKRKLVNVDVVESMRRIAVQEMNRKVFSFCDFLSFFLVFNYYTAEKQR